MSVFKEPTEKQYWLYLAELYVLEHTTARMCRQCNRVTEDPVPYNRACRWCGYPAPGH